MAIEVEGLDTELLETAIKRTSTDAANIPGQDFMFSTGRAWAADLQYPADLLARVPDTACASFAGVANPFSLGALAPGEHDRHLCRSPFEDTRRKAEKYGARGTTIKAYKPQ